MKSAFSRVSSVAVLMVCTAAGGCLALRDVLAETRWAEGNADEAHAERSGEENNASSLPSDDLDIDLSVVSVWFPDPNHPLVRGF